MEVGRTGQRADPGGQVHLPPEVDAPSPPAWPGRRRWRVPCWRVRQRQVCLDLVTVAATVLVFDDVPGCGQVGPNRMGAALADIGADRDVAPSHAESGAMHNSTLAWLVRKFQLSTLGNLPFNSRNLLPVSDFMRMLGSDPDSQQPTAATTPGHSVRCPARFHWPALTREGSTRHDRATTAPGRYHHPAAAVS
jgi:hypothetical protein